MSVAWRPIRLACNHVFCVRCLIKAQKKKMDSCPLCRHPTAVRSATALNLDESLQNFLKLYFPQEIKEKKRENEREQAIEDVQAMTGKKYTEEQLMRMNQNQSDTKCNIM
jgi:transcription elongation factor Elf1